MIILMLIGAAAFFFFKIQQYIYRGRWNRGLMVSVNFKETDIFEGEEGELLEVIENRKLLPIPVLYVKFTADRSIIFADTRGTQVTDRYYRNDVFHVGGREKITRTLTFTGTKRGYYKIIGIDVIASDLFLAVYMTENKSADKFIYVYPAPYKSEEFRLSLKQLYGEMLTKRHIQEDPFEFRGIRPYQAYDELKHINWKATAKTRGLKVNQRNYTSLRTVRVFFNVEDRGIRKRTEAVEATIRVVAGLSEYFLMQGMRISCHGNGTDIISGEPVQIEAGSGGDHMKRIYKTLARIDLSKPAADFTGHFGKKLLTEDKGTVTFFVSPNCYDDFVELIYQYYANEKDFVWFYPSAEDNPRDLPKDLTGNIRVIPSSRN